MHNQRLANLMCDLLMCHQLVRYSILREQLVYLSFKIAKRGYVLPATVPPGSLRPRACLDETAGGSGGVRSQN